MIITFIAALGIYPVIYFYRVVSDFSTFFSFKFIFDRRKNRAIGYDGAAVMLQGLPSSSNLCNILLAVTRHGNGIGISDRFMVTMSYAITFATAFIHGFGADFLRLAGSFESRTDKFTNKKTPRLGEFFIGGPNEIRTRVLALRGPRPRPLDDGTAFR